MFILSKEIIKDIVKYGKDLQEEIENEDLLLALMVFFVAPVYIFLIISAFMLDIIFFPLEVIIYLQVRKFRKEKNVKKFQPTYIIDKKGIGIKAYKYNKKSKEWERISERNK